MIILAGLLLAACTSSSDLRPSQGTQLIVKSRSYDRIFNAAVLTVAAVGAIDYQSKDEGIVRGFRGSSGFSTGEALAIFISPPRSGARTYRISIAHRSFSALQAGGSDWEQTTVAQMRARLDL